MPTSIRLQDRQSAGLPSDRLPQGCEVCTAGLPEAYRRLAASHTDVCRRWRRWQFWALVNYAWLAVAAASGWIFAVWRAGWWR